MNTAEHVAFDQLPTECKFLVILATTAANLEFGNTRHQPQDALVSTARSFWNDSRLTPSELGDIFRISDLLTAWIKSPRKTQN
jgi:hypothetical protein